jgi:menaquinone-specific isochorismate synthase
MPVIPCVHNLLNNKQELKRFILACQEDNSANGQAEIVSISKPIAPVDPLAFLEAMIQPNQLSFYWENQRKQEAVVAIGRIKSVKINEGDRFTKCQEFVEYFQKKIIKVSDLESDNFPYFFSAFPFFKQKYSCHSCFPLANVFIPCLQLIKKRDRCSLIINTWKAQKNENIKLIKKYLSHSFNNLKNYLIKNSELNDVSEPKFSQKINNSEYDNFISIVNRALKAIEDRRLSKIVVAHALEIISNHSFNIVESLSNLRQNHPDCYIFSVSNNQGDYFIGASPERLLSIQNRKLVTDALAGSAPRGKTDYEDQYLAEKLLNSEKEKREHDSVSDFIMECLSNMGLNPKKAPLQLLKLSNIQHLWTPIYAQIPSNLKPLEIISKLHPTPAVAGLPIEVACEQIRAYENFDRSLYAAPLGWIDTEGNCEFIVGIRSALIQGNKALLYAGAGIVAGSAPEQELTEIKLKFQALLQALV